MKGIRPLVVGLAVALVWVAAAGAQAPAPASAPEAHPPRADKPKPLSADGRMAIVRILAWEYATAKQPLPASQKEEEALEVAAPGKINEAKLRDNLANRGAAVHSGEIVQVTGIQFKPAYILFEINGGGKKKKKWYERIQVAGGMGGGPVVVQPPTRQPGPGAPGSAPAGTPIGSWVRLTFPDFVPDLQPDDIKQMLAGVLDFSPRSAAVPWIETIPEEFREAIKEKKAKVGMTREMVLAALGRPQSKVRETKEGVEREDWIYGNPPLVTFVTFVEDKVVEVKEFK